VAGGTEGFCAVAVAAPDPEGAGLEAEPSLGVGFSAVEGVLDELAPPALAGGPPRPRPPPRLLPLPPPPRPPRPSPLKAEPGSAVRTQSLVRAEAAGVEIGGAGVAMKE
jgi:hypothetical protein